jgi:hypothetical protein
MPDGAFHDARARGDDGPRLLPLQHRGGDFRRVGQVADARLDHFDARLLQPLLHFVLQVIGDAAVLPRSDITPGSSCES